MHGQEPQNRGDLESELSVLAEWDRVLRLCVTAALVNVVGRQESPRTGMEHFIHQSTRTRVRVWWTSPAPDTLAEIDRIVEIRWEKTCYGHLGFSPGYLDSTWMPSIPQCLGYLCGLLLVLTEHQVLVHNLAAQIPRPCTVEPLTTRERDVLLSLGQGESEEQTAQRLGIAPNTVRAHRHHLYRHLGVRSPHDAVLQGLALGLLDLLDVAHTHTFDRLET